MSTRDDLTTGDLAGTASDEDEPTARERRETADARREPLLPGDEVASFGERWQEIQAGFVDTPRESVGRADALVAELMQRLAASFASERARLEEQWSDGEDASTEDLRVALTRYRSFFERLLAA